IRSFASKIVHSTSKLGPTWRAACTELGLAEKFIPRDVRTRWNSTYDMLESAYVYRKVVDQMCSNKENGLREFIKQLCSVLKEAMLFFSSLMPNLAQVIPATDLVDQRLATAIKSSQKYNPAIRACELANKLLSL
ncbi:hypothetical protein C8Q76DRAFT_608965, partial [Earliella scabrosa]